MFNSSECRRKILLLLNLIFAVLLVASCGGPPAVETDAGQKAGPADNWTDWAHLDLCIARSQIIQNYLFNTVFAPDDPLGDYLEVTTLPLPLPAVDLPAFRKLPAADQERRAELADKSYFKACKFRRNINRRLEIQVDQRDSGAYSSEQDTVSKFVGVTHAVGHLIRATSLDPSRSVMWYDLAFFAGIGGDHDLQGRALDAALQSWDQRRGDPLLYLRILLDQAWMLRDTGRSQECLEVVTRILKLIKEDDRQTFDLAREALLIQGLALVDAGMIYEARSLAKQLGDWRVPKLSPYRPDFNRGKDHSSLSHVDSDFARDWIWALTHLVQDNAERALRQFTPLNYKLVLPPRLNSRFWNDMGQIREHFGDVAQARNCYTKAAVSNPFFLYYPMDPVRGLSRIYGHAGAGFLYVLGYKHFYLGGSLFSYAANRVLAMEMETDPMRFNLKGRAALTALSLCMGRNIHPTAARVLRGRVHYRLGDMASAEADLRLALAETLERGEVDPDAAILLGVILLDRKDFAGSLEWFDHVTKNKPEAGISWRLSGLALAQAGRLDSAVTALDLALVLEPNSITALFNRSLVLLQLGKVTEARAGLIRAHELAPDNAHVARILQLTEQDEIPQIKMKPSTIVLTVDENAADQAEKMAASSALGLLAAEADDLEAAPALTYLPPETARRILPELQARYDRQPDDSSRTDLAWCLLQAGQAAEVQQLLTPFWGQDMPHDQLFIILRADRHVGQGERAASLASGLETEESPLPDVDLWELVAVICIETERLKEARLALDLAIDLNPNNTSLLALKAQLGED